MKYTLIPPDPDEDRPPSAWPRRQLRPHIAEIPLFKTTFTDSTGSAHQATLNSTFRPSLLDPPGSESEEGVIFREAIIANIREAYAIAGCELVTLEVIRTHTLEIGL